MYGDGLIVMIILQYTLIANHYVVHLKLIPQFKKKWPHQLKSQRKMPKITECLLCTRHFFTFEISTIINIFIYKKTEVQRV